MCLSADSISHAILCFHIDGIIILGTLFHRLDLCVNRHGAHIGYMDEEELSVSDRRLAHRHRLPDVGIYNGSRLRLGHIDRIACLCVKNRRFR